MTKANIRQADAARGAVVILANFLPILAIMSVAPAIPSIVRHFGQIPNGEVMIPLMVSAPGIGVALLSPFMGWGIDRFGRRGLLLGASLLYALAGMAPLVLHDFGMIFVSRLMVGVAEAALYTISATLLIDYFDLQKRPFWMSVQGVAGPVLVTLTLASSGFLTRVVWNGAFWLYSLAFVVLLLAWRFAYEPQVARDQSAKATASPFPWAAVGVYAPIAFFVGNIFYAYILQGALLLKTVGIGDAGATGLFMSLASLGVPVAAGSFAFLSKRLSMPVLVAICLCLFGGGMVAIGTAVDYRLVLAGAFLQQLGQGLAISPLLFWSQGVLPREHRGVGMGIWMSAFSLGQFTSPLLVGAVRAGGASLPQAFVILGAASLLGALAAFLLLRWGERFKVQQDPPSLPTH